jgi:hypothetical protein
MSKKPRMTNQKLIDLLDAKVSGGSAQFRTRFYKVGKRSIRYSRSRGRYITVDKNVYWKEVQPSL